MTKTFLLFGVALVLQPPTIAPSIHPPFSTKLPQGFQGNGSQRSAPLKQFMKYHFGTEAG